MESLERISTGFEGLDEIIDYLRLGDNVVWRVDDIKDYETCARLFVKQAIEEKRKVIYMRFSDRAPILEEHPEIRVRTLDTGSGFESFFTEVYNIITREGVEAFYVFDCLSDLLAVWASDLMIANFFMSSCPYLFELDTIAYFAILRDRHSFQTTARIRETTQLFLDLYNDDGTLYVHPLKVWKRYSTTMFMPHIREGNRFVPVTDSTEAVEISHIMTRNARERAKRNLDYWDLLFLQAEELLEKPWEAERRQKMVDKLCSIMITRDPRMSILVKDNFSLEDMLSIKNRLIGTGFVGGKTTGMLLARKILLRDQSFNWEAQLEPHDSFYIGSDVFYTYLVQNGWWKPLMEQQQAGETYFEAARELGDKIREGTLPDEIREQFLQIIEYFGQSPFIVRSSSLLEDAFGTAFAGKYESFFCVNQGTPEERLAQFEEAVKKVYASTMNENALTYRREKGLQYANEQMALLVQRVSGNRYGNYFFPDVAGVGLSYNTFVWKKEMDTKAGLLRLVFGLGTRAVNRVEGDYPRIAALDLPLLKPYAGMEDSRKFSQRGVDLLDIESNTLETVELRELTGENLDLHLDRIAVRDHELDREMRERGIKGQEAWLITFDDFLSQTPFAEVMRAMLKKLEIVYNYPVDIEFTVNFTKDSTFEINLLQCRPLQTIGEEKIVELPTNIKQDKIFFSSEGNFFGGNISQSIRRVIYIDPPGYSELPLQKKYDIARLVGRLNRQITDKKALPTMLLGPGRWGSTTPSMGVPVNFAEINHITALGEIAYSHGNLMPELSFGSHFFQDLVEMSIFYLAIFPESAQVTFNRDRLIGGRNMLPELLPDAEGYSDIVTVCDFGEHEMRLMADIISQRVICFSRS
ncbi:MAG: PEP/pyruvate-binding domain-containing protein [Deltaproteobacteria bacterium]|nr:PEP/pyruvate-binding domain-containing protein [Deltaproteobacteria bacterium]